MTTITSGVTVRVLTRHDPEFYPLVGPFLARREIVAETGAPLWDDDGKLWWVALDGDAVIGVAAATDRGAYVQFCSAYVPPAHRGKGVYRRLLDARLGHFHGRQIRVTCRPSTADVYARRGFTRDRETKQYVFMRREADGD